LAISDPASFTAVFANVKLTLDCFQVRGHPPAVGDSRRCEEQNGAYHGEIERALAVCKQEPSTQTLSARGFEGTLRPIFLATPTSLE